jgi:hypothetical protein
MAGAFDLLNQGLGMFLGKDSTIGKVGGLAGGIWTALDQLNNPGKWKTERYRDPEVIKTLGMYDKNAEAIQANSPEAARQASAQSLQQGMADAQGGALNSAAGQNIASGAGNGDAGMGANVAGARAMSASLGATAPFMQALAQGHQTALGQTQQNQQNYTANTQGREQAAEAYDTTNTYKKAGTGIGEALFGGSAVGGFMGAVGDSLGLGMDGKTVSQDENQAEGIAPTQTPQIQTNAGIQATGSGTMKPPPLGMYLYTDPVTGKQEYRKRGQ